MTRTGLQCHKNRTAVSQREDRNVTRTGLQCHKDRTAVSQGQDCKVSAVGSVPSCFQLSVIVYLLSFIYCRCDRFFIMLHYL